MRKSILVAAIAAIATPAAFAGSLTSTADINLAGGMTAGYFYSTNNGDGSSNSIGGDADARYQVSDFLVELSGDATQGVGFVGAFGTLAGITVMDGGVNNSPYNFGFQYGWLTVAPVEGLTIDAGMLATNVGYEVAPSYDNPHATIAALWGGQPVYYPGVRATYEANDMGFYVEANSDSLGTATSAWAAGVSGSVASMDYIVSYYNYNGYKALVDVIVSGEMGGLPMAVNFDYQMLSDKPAGSQDDSGFGLAFYITPSVGEIDLPIRVEYLSDGDSGIYSNVNSAYTFTITPTYNFSDNTFVRAELSYVGTDNKIFYNETGDMKDAKTSVALQAGFTF